ncbi:Hsp90 cochaperone SHQ1 KNAG_0E01960 [Huiozyma naganishii CBS 8797]|uniref:CS domain-containing protein n=1 Tax=Huiozyma naganishii (strain ATCC MYA-139 / BCRC 22969 / CBS 8797 / KCTC 17520 / NBRC 10181 / NCYC 3082 / Yp74L-3) TaxID=1071383 RepID=J7RLR1_HUIN7|nr:hypothetical protein KNAG_0E01960 [Kazachstania naganishii CBS 8797]CCK70458.1 hypothetical protein KNAG_0E01960 [Kazachstania naganishii CBS 8797]
MLTPKFDITQDDEFIHVKIYISSIRFSSHGVEVVIDGNTLIFHLAPYYLRLRFDNELVEDERASTKFIVGEECILVTAPKRVHGQVFEDLDLHSKLLARINDDAGKAANDKPNGPLIQELDSKRNTAEDPNELKNISEQGQAFDWEIEQTEQPEKDILNGAKYGFDGAYSDIIGLSISNGNEINGLRDPEHTNANERCVERLRTEDVSFDDGYYASEYMTGKYGDEDDLMISRIREIMSFTPPIIKDYLDWRKTEPDTQATMPIEFSDKEKEQMQKNLPHKSYSLLSSETTKLSYITILNILFSYSFDLLENEGDQTSESIWTVGKLTPQIAYLDQQLVPEEPPLQENVLIKEATHSSNNPATKQESIIQSSIRAGFRRSLCYPLHRVFDLSERAWRHAYHILSGGKRLVIKVLLAVHELFRYHDVYYVYNKCLLDDLCSWFIDQGNETVIRSLALEVHKELSQVSKSTVDFLVEDDDDDDAGINDIDTDKPGELLTSIPPVQSEEPTGGQGRPTVRITINEVETLAEQMYAQRP